jgi:hypothetical protein
MEEKQVAVIKWILSDACFKALEQIGPVAERWIERLEDAFPEIVRDVTSRKP